MWKVTILSATVFTLILIEAAPKTDDSGEYSKDHKGDCDQICSSSGAEAHFNEESLTCKCVLVTNMNETEMAIVEKNAKLLNLHLESTEPLLKTVSRKRRRISTNKENKIAPLDIPRSDNSDPIVGQAFGHHSKLLPPSLPLLPPPTHHLSPNRPSISREAAFQRVTKIRQSLRDLLNHPTARDATARADAIRQSLRDLSQHIIIGPNPEHNARIAEYRARAAAERAKINQERKLRHQRLNSAGLFQRKPIGLLGAAPSNSLTTTSPQEASNDSGESNQTPVNANISHNAIITQPKDLIED